MAHTYVVPARVVRVIDGDTLVLSLDIGWSITLENQHVRLGGVDAPEISTPEGKDARNYVVGLCPAGAFVTLTSHELDKYGRVLGLVSLQDGTDLSQSLISTGHGKPYDGGKRG